MTSKIFLGTFLVLSVIILLTNNAIISQKTLLTNYDRYEALYRNYIIELNRQKIRQFNQQNTQFQLAANKFISYSPQEFENLFLVTKVPTQAQVIMPLTNSTTQLSTIDNYNKKRVIFLDAISTNFNTLTNDYLDIDWKKAGKVTSIKNQGGCGSCWAFAAISDLQSSYLLGGYPDINIDLSEQQLVDCASKYYNFGCAGGWMTNAFAYIFKNSITTQADYPYTARDQTCKTTKGNFTLKNLRSYWKNENCQLLVDILRERPVSVAVAADPVYWGFYKSGILTQCPGTINHGVIVTGVKKDLTENYWIVKNSWGADWGENGYIRLDRNQKGGNICQVCSYPQYSII